MTATPGGHHYGDGNVKKLELVCDYDYHDGWRVYCRKNRKLYSHTKSTSEEAWTDAAHALASKLSEVIRVSCEDDMDYEDDMDD